MVIDECGGSLSVVKAMVAVYLLERVPYTAIDSSSLLTKLETDHSHTAAEKAAIRVLGGGVGGDNGIEIDGGG